MKPKRPKLLNIFALCLIAIAIGGTLGSLQPKIRPLLSAGLSEWFPPQPVRVARPYGMAPIAFEAYIRACDRTGIHPLRIGQTIGDAPRSVGYHKRDGVLRIKGQRVDYSAAVDISVHGLNRAQIDRFVNELGKQGFAAWFRHGPRWVNAEHIHAVYALLPMKLQLRGQVEQFQRERREAGLRPLKWEAKLRRYQRVWRARYA